MKWVLWLEPASFLGCAAAIVRYSWAWDARHMTGMALAAVGFALWFTARLQLGKSFVILPRARALVTKGLYSKFRNPIYLFGGLAAAGLLIAWGKVIPLIAFFLFYPIYQFLRARKEAEVLEQKFGDEYRRYRASTWL
jgi:protein-S-isoprenylcysteine O-methyltransferase Ste14